MSFLSASDSGGGDVNYISDSQSLGLPADPNPNASQVPGLESTQAADIPAPSFFSHPIDWITTETSKVASGAEDIAKTAYGDAKSAIGTVASDIANPIASSLKTTYWYLIFGLVVIAGGLYFVGKTGAFKVNAVV